MAATPNSIYQAIRAKHVANIPPNAYPQTDFETWKQYVIRMASQGLPVDINATESDAEYETRLASYAGPVPYENISSSFALIAATALGTITNALTASYISSSKTFDLGKIYNLSASFALVADNVNGSITNATMAATASKVEAVIAAGTAVSAISTTSGYAVYAQSFLTEAVGAVQTGNLTNNLNRGVISAYRAVGINGFDTIQAAFTVTDENLTGSAPLIEAKMFDATVGSGTSVFKVDKTGSLWSSGSKGFTGDVMFEDSGALKITMSFQGGLFIAQT